LGAASALLGLVVPIVLVTVWLVASEATEIPDYLLPSPAITDCP